VSPDRAWSSHAIDSKEVLAAGAAEDVALARCHVVGRLSQSRMMTAQLLSPNRALDKPHVSAGGLV